MYIFTFDMFFLRSEVPHGVARTACRLYHSSLHTSRCDSNMVVVVMLMAMVVMGSVSEGGGANTMICV